MNEDTFTDVFNVPISTSISDQIRQRLDQQKYYEKYYGGRTVNTTQGNWESIRNRFELEAAQATVKLASGKRTLNYRGISFVVVLDDEVLGFFEDPKNITRDELHLLEITHPEAYAKVRERWMDVWIKLQAQKAFENP